MEQPKKARNRHWVAEVSIQSRVRLLHRDLESNLHACARDYFRKQTSAGGERYIHAGAEGIRRESARAPTNASSRASSEIFESLRQRVAAESPRVLDTARARGRDRCAGRTRGDATACNYTKPHVHDGDEIRAIRRASSVVERLAGGTFVPNDVPAERTTHQLAILTGPNMGGKSTYLRQVGLLCLLAQTGSFVPGARCEDRLDRSALRARRRIGQHRPWTVDVHGRDAGDGEHPQRGDVEKPRGAR
jgi:DNA mismatch repair ATPase MutS